MKLLKTAILSAAIAMSAIYCAAQTAPPQPLSARLSIGSESARPSEPVSVEFIVENVSGSEILLPAGFFTAAEPGKTGMFFFITGPDGLSLDSVCPAAPGKNTSLITMNPGEYHGRKNIHLNECFNMKKAGRYSVRAIFTSAEPPAGAWAGTLKSPAVSVTILESPERKSATEASLVIADWQQNYNVAASRAYKQKLLSIGLPAAVAVTRALNSSLDYSFSSDLIDVLGSLPCRESGDALIEFIGVAPNRNFKSNMPEGFTPGTVLVGEVFQALQKMSREDLKTYKRIHKDVETGDLWKWWWRNNREMFPAAVPEEGY